jgi:zinc protease
MVKKLFSLCIVLTVFALIPPSILALDVSRKTLSNGLLVLHSEKHALPIVMVTLLVKAGQVNEPAVKAGLAHLTAELLTEGTQHRSSLEISEEIEFIGASLDASAERDYTTISLSVLKKDVHKGFEVFADILLNPTFPQGEIDRKRERIKGFMKQQEEDPSFLAERSFIKEVFGNYPYGRLIEGNIKTIDSITRHDISLFHGQFFLPNNAILSVVGDLTDEELDSLIEQYLSRWKRNDLPSGTVESINEKRNNKLVTINRDLKQASILLGNLGISRNNPDYYAVLVMNYILGGGGFTSRLMQSVRDEMGLTYSIYSFFEAYKHGGMFEVGVQTKNESANTVIEEILRQIKRIRKEEVTDEELSDAQAYLTGSFPRRLDTNRKIANFLVAVEFYDLGLDYVEKYPHYINSVTKEDILRVAKKYLDPENYVLVVVADQEKAHIQDSYNQ